jgi:hypothetical protein
VVAQLIAWSVLLCGTELVSRSSWTGDRVGPVCKIERDFGRSSPAALELVPAQKLDRVLHTHHTEVATATGDAVVNGVAEQFLSLAGELGCD